MNKISIQQSNQLKSIAILMMLCFHLFNTLDYEGLFQPLIFIGPKPLIYYISLFCDACVPIFAFVSGYGLYFQYQNNNKETYNSKNKPRLKKLYQNLWVIILLFPIAIGFILQKQGYPGSIWNVLGNASGLLYSYNGVWWFFTIYVLFVLSSRFWFGLLNKLPAWLIIIASGFIYVGAFYVRIYVPLKGTNAVLNWLQTNGALFFCTLPQFMLGAFTYKWNWDTKIFSFWKKSRLFQLVLYLGVVILIVVHGVIPNFIIAPILAMGFIKLFINMRFGIFINNILDFFTPHATNLWLVHMFFYMIFFKEFIYSVKFVPLIFLLLLLVCIMSSVVINAILKLISRFV